MPRLKRTTTLTDVQQAQIKQLGFESAEEMQAEYERLGRPKHALQLLADRWNEAVKKMNDPVFLAKMAASVEAARIEAGIPKGWKSHRAPWFVEKRTGG